MSKPTEVQLKEQPGKEVLDVVMALGPDGKVCSIPPDVAEKHLADDEGHEPFEPARPEEKVPPGGHYSVWRSDGTSGPHLDRACGFYTWHADGRVCRGLHRHLNPHAQLAQIFDG